MSEMYPHNVDVHHRSSADKFVCATCLEDEALQQFANQNTQGHNCDYCGQTSMTAGVVPLDRIIEFMRGAIKQEWDDPANDAPLRESSEGGGYDVHTIDGETLLSVIGFDVSNRQLMADITSAFEKHDWCARDWELLSPTERWSFGWDRFQHVVKHQRRYTFWYSKDDIEDVSHPDYLPPADMLKEIESVIRGMKLVKEFPVGYLFWRLQPHPKGKIPSAPREFTSPPIELAKQPNRMSPAGVPMFYGADDFETAHLELVDANDWDGKSVSGVQFKNVIPINLLDLTSIPSPPSYFSPRGPIRRHYVHFLNKFVERLSEPIDKDGREHIEYVPTQVFTEFVRHVMKGPGGAPVHGIRYSSSKNRVPCYVIFATQEECLPCAPLDMHTQMLEFVPGSIKTTDEAPVSRSKDVDFIAEIKAALGNGEKNLPGL
jgi:hypothetical protein